MPPPFQPGARHGVRTWSRRQPSVPQPLPRSALISAHLIDRRHTPSQAAPQGHRIWPPRWPTRPGARPTGWSLVAPPPSSGPSVVPPGPLAEPSPVRSRPPFAHHPTPDSGGRIRRIDSAANRTRQGWSLVAFPPLSTGHRNHPLESCRACAGVLSRDSRFSTGVLSLKLLGGTNSLSNSLRDKTPNCRRGQPVI